MIPMENHSHTHLLESSRSLNIHADTAKYKEEHTSPVSVLEPFCSPEYVNSPTSIMSKSGKEERSKPTLLCIFSFLKSISKKPLFLTADEYSSLQPRRIAFDDPKTNTNVCTNTEEEESLHGYVKEIIEASEMSLSNEIYQNGPSKQDILYKCIADIMESYSYESYCELQLLFDCIHEVLSRIYSTYFGYPPWLSFLNRKIRPFPHGEKEQVVVDEVVKEVNLYLLQKEWQPTLDQIVEEDLRKSACSWPDDLCVDTEEILIQIAEDVLQDSIQDAVLGFLLSIY